MTEIATAFQLLQWYATMGVDEAIGEAPTDWTVRRAPQASAVSISQTQAASRPVLAVSEALSAASQTASTASGSSSLAAAVALAQKLAQEAPTLAALKKAVETFDGCALKATASNTVFADGNPDSDIMIIGEAPGAEEDRQGIPFCGQSGQLLDAMLATIGLNRKENCYITNTLFWRPPGNRTPNPEELAICKPFVERHIALFNPKLLILCGSTAVKGVLDSTDAITRLRGKSLNYQNDSLEQKIPVRVLFHPSYLLRQPLSKRMAWADLLGIQQVISQLR